MKKIWIPFLAAGALWFAYEQIQKTNTCQTDEITEQTGCPSPIQVYEDPARIPLRTFVLNEMGDLKGKTVLDIGAGPGFFAFEMAKSADKVIASEIDPLFLDYMNEKKSKANINNFEVLPANDSHSEFDKIRVDYALMVYVFHYLDDPKLFLAQLKKAIVPGGKIFIANAQMSTVIIKDYLEMAGFINTSEAHFSYPQSGCGDIELQLISAEIPNLQVHTSMEK